MNASNRPALHSALHPFFTFHREPAKFQAVIPLARVRAAVNSNMASLALSEIPMPTLLFSPIARRAALSVLVALVCFFAVGCGNNGHSSSAVTVFAAASLTDAFRDIARDFELANPDVEVILNFAGSQRLRSQLELGAKADVFASANESQMALAEEGGLVVGKGVPFAKASMAVIVSAGSGIVELKSIATPGVKLVLAHENVPAGLYARQLLESLSETDSELGSDFAERTLANTVSHETSVKVVEQKVVLGQADAGIVYRPGAITAVASGAAKELPLPPASAGVQASFPIAILRSSESREAANLFVSFVLSPPAKEILSSYGFDSP